jgi:hypothetical protein
MGGGGRIMGDYIAQSFNGIGTKLYGKRDFRTDASYVTTKWCVVALIPIVPLDSYRVMDEGPTDSGPLPGWGREYRVLSRCELSIVQVGCTYAFLLFPLFVSPCISVIPIESLQVFVWCLFIGAWAAAPWGLRRRARSKLLRSGALSRGTGGI